MIDMDKEWISPSEESQEALKEQILKAMFPIIKLIEADEEHSVSVSRIFEALQVGKSWRKKQIALSRKRIQTKKHLSIMWV